QERTYYNLGNTEYRLGIEAQAADKKQAEWEQAIGNYESALKLNPKDEDAKFNLELVKKQFEELQKQQQQQKQQQSKDDQNKDDKKQAEAKKANESKENKPENGEDQQAQAMKGVMARMTPEQAQLLLDAQKADEKPLNLIPKLKTNRTDRVFKDW